MKLSNPTAAVPFLEGVAAPSGQRMLRSKGSYISEAQVAEMEKWTNQQVIQWLQSIGLGNFAADFQTHGIVGDMLPLLNEADLIQMGISLVGPRKRMLKELARIKKSFRAYTRHAVIWRGEEDMARGDSCRSCFMSCCPLCYDPPARYRLTGTQLKISATERGGCCGLCALGSRKLHHNISLKEIVDIDTDRTKKLCGTERRVVVMSQEGINEGRTEEHELFIDGKGDNTLTNVSQLIQSAVEDAKEALIIADD